MKGKLTMAQCTLAGLIDGMGVDFITPNIHQPWIRIETWSRLAQMGVLAPVLMESYSHSLHEDSEDDLPPHFTSGLIEVFVVRRMLRTVFPEMAVMYERHCMDVVDRVWFNGDELTRQLYLPYLLSGHYSAEYITADSSKEEEEVCVPRRFVIANSMIRDLENRISERSIEDNSDLIGMRKRALAVADRLGLEQFSVLLDSVRNSPLEVISRTLV